MSIRRAVAATMTATILAAPGLPIGAAQAMADSARAEFENPRQPPPFRPLDAEEAARYALGQAVFNSSWFAAGASRATRRDGLGPVFNAASCDACHNNGARASAPDDDGRLPTGFVLQLESGSGGSTPLGDVLNPAAIEGFRPEGQARVEYSMRAMRYPDGSVAYLREPRYRLQGHRIPELAPDTVLKPRMASPVFGSGLLEAVPAAFLAVESASVHRFGWQSGSRSIREQSAKAFSREMGLTSSEFPQDDCGSDAECLGAANGGMPEVSDAFLDALSFFQALLAVPRAPALAPEREHQGAELFERSGCTGCHTPTLPVEGIDGMQAIHAFTDLQRHDLGDGLADRRLDGTPVASRWRTPPLWGIGHQPRGGALGLLHDGRARTIEEAILWHAGAAEAARASFMSLPNSERERLVEWVLHR